jgi:DnaJ family protein C protein 28
LSGGGMKGRDRQSWLDKVILEAQEQGLFDNLKGMGQPIDWEDESLVDETWVTAFRIMRQQGFAPEWIELHKEIGVELDKARQALRETWRWRHARLAGADQAERRYLDGEWQRACTAFEEVIAALNEKIADFNLKVPVAALQKFKLDVAQELAAVEADA